MSNHRRIRLLSSSLPTGIYTDGEFMDALAAAGGTCVHVHGVFNEPVLAPEPDLAARIQITDNRVVPGSHAIRVAG